MSIGSVRRFAPFVALVVLVVAGIIYLALAARASAGALEASGTISAIEVVVAPEISGRVLEVQVEEGEQVEAGQLLLRLDSSLLEAQRDRALAALALAEASLRTAEASMRSVEAQYDLALNAARLQALPGRLAAWTQETPWQFELPTWYFEQGEEIAAAEAELGAAEQSVVQARQALGALLTDGQRASLQAAEERLARAVAAYQVARDVQSRSAMARNTDDLLAAADDRLESARLALEQAQSAYDDLFSEEADSDVLRARADLALAQARFDAANDRLRQLQTGDYSLQVQAADALRRQAQAAVDQARAVVAQAEADLAALDVQLARLEVTSPVGGVIVTRSIEPGEVVVPGAPVMTVGQLDDLTITVYLAEDRYGEVGLGDGASVTVDSFPDEVFEAEVTRIASRAEFTPRNVQTEEGRRTTVFAVVLTLSDPGGLLKPGMPADVLFDQGE